MAGIVCLGESFTVELDKVELPFPPTKSTAVLFCGLLIKQGIWVDRSSIATKLFPDHDPILAGTATRQTLHRLQKWLGNVGIEVERSRVRLTEDYWTIDQGHSGDLMTRGQKIAPMLVHPWMQQVRSSLQKVTVEPAITATQTFFDAVIAASALDREVARSILVGGEYLVLNAHAIQVEEMMAATKPDGVKDALSAEYALLASLVSLRFGRLEEGCKMADFAYQIANKKHQRSYAASAAGFALFMNLELGNVENAKNWKSILARSERSLQSRMLVTNANFGFYWHTNQFAEALVVIDRGRAVYKKSSRRDAMHFWTNVAVFACETSNRDLAVEAFRTIERLEITAMDNWYEKIQRLGFANFERAFGDLETAHVALKQLGEDCQIQEYPYLYIYACEARAEVLFDIGDTVAAQQLWQSCEESRRNFGWVAGERHGRRRSRIWQFTA